MPQSRWLRVIVGVGIAVLLLTPLILLFVRQPRVQELLPLFLQKPQKEVTSDRYSVVSEVPGYSLKLLDTKYLDYMTAKLGIFNNEAVVGPKIYRGFPDLKQRFTVSNISFVLVPMVETPLVLDSANKSFIGRAEYRVERDTLVVLVSLDISELTKGRLATKFSLEDEYIRMSLFGLYYAHGLSDQRTNTEGMFNIRQDIKNNLHSGLFPWPFRIEEIGK